ncbi:exodeoxyribonuclease V subunit beta [Dyadobacter sp. CY312]|uniref:UvrD-helicase domain-containing protein n=1 Tax=Dyadobacter sp. CY312 TaxID=2907303 RepID=UPI001F35DC7C|nr:UvrD-helicase domain-containing protein [Dyadobacter sp. CY312]MCE7039381.1 UvrD-helicase domain-containing protein [Dyadobacter sp. CY312]
MFKVYSSSAGSGKTYTLTKEYIKLALHSNSDTYFRQILAVTFTNAAANEMKDRILLMLRTFAAYSPDAQLPPMLRDVVQEMYPDTVTDEALFEGACELISGRAQLVFRQILHRYSDFSVMTIDKFTQRLISSFTDELGIPFVFETQLDGDLLNDAVDRLLARIGQEGEEVLTDIVEKYYRENAEDGKSWGALPVKIRETSGTLLSEQSYLQMQRVAGLRMEDWITIRNQMKRFVKERETKVTDLAKRGFDLIQEGFLVDKDFYQGGRGIYGFFKDRSEGKKLWAEPNSYAYKTIGEETWYGAKTPGITREKIEEIRPDLENCFHQIENIRQAEGGKITLYNLLERHIYNLSLLGEVRKEFDALLKQNNQVHISDFNKKILEIVSQEPVPFIFERLGEKYNHILVDEFQDTSKLQFANLLPLIENALADGYFNLIVGDAKQSIYRFRGGDMDLLLHLAQDQVMLLTSVLGESDFNQERLWSLDNYLKVDHLRTNRRSFREITDFNNRFFSFVANLLTPEYPLAGDVYDENFQQQIPDGVSEGGHVQMEFLEMNDNTDEASGNTHDAIVKRTLELVEELRSTGYNWRDVAILCRRKSEATAIANVLKEAGFPLISDDALLLAYSRSIHFVISFMKVLQTSDHKLARYETAYLFHHVIRKQNPGPTEYEAIRKVCSEPGLDSFLEYFSRWGISLTAFRMRQLSVFELSEKLIQTFGLFEAQTDKEYLFRFLDVVQEFGTRRTNHLGDFLAYWDTARTKLSITIPADTDALRITTIHKSKGLEYPVVIVPYANWKFTPNASLDRLWVDLDEVDYEELFLPGAPDRTGLTGKLRSSMVSVQKELENTVIAEQYVNEKTRKLVETMNLLYVAFTRPIQRLYILAKKEKNWQSAPNVGMWLHDYLSQPEFVPGWEESKDSYVLYEGTEGCRHAHVRSDFVPFIMKDILSNDRTNTLRLRRMADRIFDIETFEPKYDRLQKVRYLLTRLRSFSDLPETITSLMAEGIFTRNEAGAIREQVKYLLENPSLKELYDDSNALKINKDLLIPGGKLLHIDRMVQLADGNYVFMSFVGGNGSDENRRHLRKLVQAYKNIGKESRGVMITLENEMVEWI